MARRSWCTSFNSACIGCALSPCGDGLMGGVSAFGLLNDAQARRMSKVAAHAHRISTRDITFCFLVNPSLGLKTGVGLEGFTSPTFRCPVFFVAASRLKPTKPFFNSRLGFG